jgi:hypothetical protein
MQRLPAASHESLRRASRGQLAPRKRALSNAITGRSGRGGAGKCTLITHNGATRGYTFLRDAAAPWVRASHEEACKPFSTALHAVGRGLATGSGRECCAKSGLTVHMLWSWSARMQDEKRASSKASKPGTEVRMAKLSNLGP